MFGLGPSVSWVQSLCYLGAVFVIRGAVLVFSGVGRMRGVPLSIAAAPQAALVYK